MNTKKGEVDIKRNSNTFSMADIVESFQLGIFQGTTQTKTHLLRNIHEHTKS